MKDLPLVPMDLLNNLKKGSKEGFVIIDINRDVPQIGPYINNSDIRK